MSPAEVATVLRVAGCVFAEEEAQLLLEHAGSGPELDDLVRRRVAGEPLEQLLGWVAFDGLRVPVAPGVFVPRRRTEHLVHIGAALLEGRDAPVVLDLCCGVGALGLTLWHRRPDVRLHAADIDPAAVRAARTALHGTGAQVHLGDLLEAVPAELRGSLDLVLVNAPYVPSGAVASMPSEARDHEPALALDGGADGVDVHRRVAAAVGDWLAPRGHVVVETGRSQAPLTVTALQDAGLQARVVTDDDLDATAAVARARATRR